LMCLVPQFTRAPDSNERKCDNCNEILGSGKSYKKAKEYANKVGLIQCYEVCKKLLC